MPEDASTPPGASRPDPTEPGPGRVLPGDAEPADAELLCSAKGCRQPALWALLWRNPRIHGPERTKRWLACDEHRPSLADFLARRDFPLQVQPLDPALPAAAPTAPPRPAPHQFG